jgi:Zn-dependent peptidase ImmA (M78 family)
MVMRRQLRWTSSAANRLRELAGGTLSVEDSVKALATTYLSGVSTPPTDLPHVAEKLGIRDFIEDDVPFSGELSRSRNGTSVIYSRHLSRSRRRFTIAHELAHAMFDTKSRRFPRVGKELERICDMLAVELLMPVSPFMAAVSGVLIPERVFDTAALFQTSIATTALRCAELYRITAFEVEDQYVKWGYGLVKTGNLRALSYSMRTAVVDALDGKRNAVRISAQGIEWRLESAPVGQGRRAMFMLRPEPKAGASNQG